MPSVSMPKEYLGPDSTMGMQVCREKVGGSLV